MRIFKYELKIDGSQKVEIPCGAKILKISMQSDTPCAWFSIPDNHEGSELVQVVMVGTGHEYKQYEAGEYVDTIMLYQESLVLHVFIKTL